MTRLNKALFIVLMLSGCSYMETPEDKYFAAVSMVKATGQLVETYVDTCRTQPKENPCYNKFPAINSGTILLKDTMQKADRVFVNKDKDYYDLAFTTAINAALSLRTTLKE